MWKMERAFSVCSFEGIWGGYGSRRFSFYLKRIGESYNGSMTVSKTVHGGSNPSSPVVKSLEVQGFFCYKKSGVFKRIYEFM